jgi:acetyl esterase/lipase
MLLMAVAALIGFSIAVGGSPLAAHLRQQAPQPEQPQQTSPVGQVNSQRSDAAVTTEENVQYGPESLPQLKLDVYKPANRGPEPSVAIILIHGGGWTAFDKSTMRDMGRFLARFGFVAFSIDYRLFQGSQNLWPAQLDDAQRAVRWVRANADRYGINPNAVGAFGHSAGAQIAALLGMEDTRDNSDPALAKYSSRVDAVVDQSGPTDFTTERDPTGEEFLAQFFGGDLSGHEAVWRDASPVFHVAKDNAPFLIVHGTQDQEVPIAQAEELYAKLQAAGVSASFVKVEDGHTFQTPEARRQLAIQSLTFFNQYLAKH